jgi:TonB family protein
VIRFDIDERFRDEVEVGSAISRRESVMMSVTAHGLLLAAIIFAPRLSFFQPDPEDLKRQEAERAAALARERENRTFVFVRPNEDVTAPKPPERGELSDLDRRAQDPVVSAMPENPLPYSKGTTTERVEESTIARGAPNEPPAPQTPMEQGAEKDTVKVLPKAETGYTGPRTPGSRLPGGSPIGEALRNFRRYAQDGTFDNPQGGAGQPGSAIQFDTKGVEFGPWIRRFVAQVKRNWFVPQAALLLKGRVVLQFNIHKDGRITDIAIVAPAQVDAFNKAAYNAILTSNPTEPLPPEYPSDKALFTVTFYYNEDPSQ